MDMGNGPPSVAHGLSATAVFAGMDESCNSLADPFMKSNVQFIESIIFDRCITLMFCDSKGYVRFIAY